MIVALGTSLLAAALPFPSMQAVGSTPGAPVIHEEHILPILIEPQAGGPTTARLQLDGEELTLEWSPHSVRGENFEVRLYRDETTWVPADVGEPRTVRGFVRGVPGSQLAGSWLDDGLHARVLLPSEELWIEPAPGEGALEHKLLRSPRTLASTSALQRGAGVLGDYIAELGVDADFEFVTDEGSDILALEEIEMRLNVVNFQTSIQVGLVHELGTVLLRTTSAQPYTSTNPNQLLTQLREHWNNNQAGATRDTVHLFTNKVLSPSTASLAFRASGCDLQRAYGLSRTFGSLPCRSEFLSRGVGLNWGGEVCNCLNSTFHTFLSCANAYDVDNILRILQYLGTAPCLDRECFATASMTPRTAGINSNDFTATNVIMGGTWTVTMEPATTNHLFGNVLAFNNPGSFLLPNGYTLLGAPPDLLNQPFQFGSPVQFDLPVPVDPDICGLSFTCQGIHYLLSDGTQDFALTNGFDGVIGL